jgi:hypothetical protein
MARVRARALVLLPAALAACDRGSPPDIAGLTDQVAYVGQQLAIALDGTDPDGDRLVYSFKPDVPLVGAASITVTPDGSGMFRWTPLAGDVGMHVFDFSAYDGSHTTTVSIGIDVRETSAGPVFREPIGTGTVLDLAQMPCLTIDVVVEDPASATVDIAQQPPVIDGATLQPVDGLSATWKWCPTSAQAAAQQRYTLELSADDHANPKAIDDYIIVLASSGAPTLVVNEVDYDQPSTDTAEYVEILNTGSATASLAGYALVLVNGADNTEYARVDLSAAGSLAAGAYLVVAGSAVTPDPAAIQLDPAWTHDAIQNGSPDGLAIVDTVALTVVDALSYGGSIAAATITGFSAPVSLVEGTPTSAHDSSTAAGTLCRDPNGQDTNDAATDWTFCTHVTPGAANQP